MSPRKRIIRTDPPPLPPQLKGESPLVKFMWIWLRPQGVVSYSTRDMSTALGLAQPSLGAALNRLRELGLIEDRAERKSRAKAIFEAVDPRADQQDVA